MTNFFGLVKYVGIGVLVLMGVLVVVAAIASVLYTLAPDLLNGFLRG